MSRLVASHRVCQNVSCVCPTSYRFWLTHVYQNLPISLPIFPVEKGPGNAPWKSAVAACGLNHSDIGVFSRKTWILVETHRRRRRDITWSVACTREKIKESQERTLSARIKFTRLLFPLYTIAVTTVKREGGGRGRSVGGNRGGEPDVCSVYLSLSLSLSLTCERGREITRPFVLSYRARNTATHDDTTRRTIRYDTRTSDTILGSRLSLTSSPRAEGVSQKRRAVSPPALLRRHMEPRLG